MKKKPAKQQIDQVKKPSSQRGRHHNHTLPEQIKEHTWKPGQSGNPNGRPPKEQCIPDILRTIGVGPASKLIIEKLKAQYPGREGLDIINARQAMLLTCYYDAQDGDKDAREFIATRTEGKIRDVVQITDDRIVVRADLPDISIPTGEIVGDENGTTSPTSN